MDLKKILGENYKEGMTFEEISEALSDLPDEFVDKKDYDKLKDQKDKASKEASDYKKKYNSTLTEKEQLELQQQEDNEELLKKYNNLLRENNITKQKASLIAIGYDEKLAEETATAMIDGDYTKVIANQSKFAESVKKTTTDELLKNTPNPEGGIGNEGITAEQFKKMSLSEKQKLYETDIDTFNELVKGV